MVKGRIYYNLQGFFILGGLEEEVRFDLKMGSPVEPEMMRKGKP